jgi:hypothetical protein
MNRYRTYGLVLALAAAFAARTTPAGAAEAARDTMPLKFSVHSTVDLAATYTIPLDPPLTSQKLTGVGESALTGKFTTLEHVFAQHGVDDQVIAEDVVGALTTAGGDVLFYTVRGLTQSVDYVFTITGGKGRFRGASGSGVMKPEFGPVPEEFTCHFEGTISIPRAVQ